MTDYVSNNFNDLKHTYDLFLYNTVDPYTKLLDKNDSINDIYLSEYINDFKRYDLQNCNFVDTSTPKIYENKILKRSDNYSIRKLNSLEPNEEYPEYGESNDLKNDFYNEVDIKFNLDQLRFKNMDVVFGQYLSNRGPDNQEGGFHDWANPPDFSELKYKTTDKKTKYNDIEYFSADFLNSVDKKVGYKSKLKEHLSNKLKYNFILLSDITFKQPDSSYIFTAAEKYNHYKGMSGLINNTEMNLPPERIISYNSYLKPNLVPTVYQATNDINLYESDTKHNNNYKELMINRNSSVELKDTHLRNDIKHALFEIFHYDLDQLDTITSNSVSNGNRYKDNKILNVLNLDILKFKDNKNISFLRKSPEYKKIRSIVEHYLQDKDIKSKKTIDLDNKSNNTKFNRINEPKYSSNIYKIIKEEYKNMIDSKQSKFSEKEYTSKNIFNKINQPKINIEEQKLSRQQRNLFSYGEYINNNEKTYKDIKHLKDGFNNRNKTIDESLYEESFDTNDNIEFFNKNNYNKNFSNLYTYKNIINETCFGGFS